MNFYNEIKDAMNPKYYDRDGNQITVEEFEKKRSDIDYQRVGFFETLANGEKVTVSTVWIGADYQRDGKRLYQSMVFNGRNNGLTRYYATELEALVGHNEVVDIVQDTLY